MHSYRILVGKRPRRRQAQVQDNIKMEIIWGGMDWFHLAHNRGQWWALVKTVTKFQVSYNFGKLSS
jgi:hypothetical protein